MKLKKNSGLSIFPVVRRGIARQSGSALPAALQTTPGAEHVRRIFQGPEILQPCAFMRGQLLQRAIRRIARRAGGAWRRSGKHAIRKSGIGAAPAATMRAYGQSAAPVLEMPDIYPANG